MYLRVYAHILNHSAVGHSSCGHFSVSLIYYCVTDAAVMGAEIYCHYLFELLSLCLEKL